MALLIFLSINIGHRWCQKYKLLLLSIHPSPQKFLVTRKELASDAGHLLENIIYLELKRRNNQIWIGKTSNLEVDFVVRNNKGFTQYIQVSQTVQNATTLERELAPFNKIEDHHEKLLITMDYDTGTYNGIKKINAIDWLTKTEE